MILNISQKYSDMIMKSQLKEQEFREKFNILSNTYFPQNEYNLS